MVRAPRYKIMYKIVKLTWLKGINIFTNIVFKVCIVIIGYVKG